MSAPFSCPTVTFDIPSPFRWACADGRVWQWGPRRARLFGYLLIPMSADAGQRIQELAAQVVELRDAYYQGDPLVADADYDALEDELRELVAAHPELAPDPNPLDSVGATAALHAPVRHSRPMLSLEKANAPEQVGAFFGRFPGQSVV